MLPCNITLTEALVIDKEVTIDLNGYTITGGLFAESNGEMTEGTTDSYAFWVKKGGKLTINGEGYVKSQAAAYSMAVWADGGEVIINGGTFENAGDGCDLIYAKNGGKVTITNGIFKATHNTGAEPGTRNEYSALNLNDKTSGNEIIVSGGKFFKFDPSNNMSENPKENFVADGYKVVVDGDYYVVVPE